MEILRPENNSILSGSIDKKNYVSLLSLGLTMWSNKCATQCVICKIFLFNKLFKISSVFRRCSRQNSDVSPKTFRKLQTITLFLVRAGYDIIKADFMHTKRTVFLTKMKIGIHFEELK